ncbi:MAG: glucosaminidase domain-containing protein [Bacteroidaceae bacterium]|nr:glucosaminidase domain-containing protein [Bacteroidaceae bacterium]
MRKIHTILLLIALLSGNMLYAQYTNSAYHQYIERYKDMAQEQMRKHGIPASITLAQGLLESGAGRSELATKANNHFGIKVGMGWNGPYMIKSDDRPDDRFRKYNNAAESFEDHSQFLLKPRYASLFKLSPTDYKGWARGLKQCGYATSPTYAEQLITIIENYKLYQYDTLEKKHRHAGSEQAPVPTQATPTTAQTMRELAEQAFFAAHPVQACNENYYIVAQAGDDLSTISLMTDVSKRKLRKYNELPRDYTPQAGDILYLQKKQSHADKSLKGMHHTIQAGESMHDIAQRYGIRLESLYKLNSLGSDYTPLPGQMLRIY